MSGIAVLGLLFALATLGGVALKIGDVSEQRLVNHGTYVVRGFGGTGDGIDLLAAVVGRLASLGDRNGGELAVGEDVLSNECCSESGIILDLGTEAGGLGIVVERCTSDIGSPRWDPKGQLRTCS